MGSVPPCQTRAFTYNLVLDLKKFVLDKRNEAIGHVLRNSPSVRSKLSLCWVLILRILAGWFSMLGFMP